MTMPPGHKPKRGEPRKVGDVVPCRCGCGLTFVMSLANANRRFAPGCTTRPYWAQAEVILKRKVVANKKRLSKLREQRAAVKICKECCDLPHARPESGCKTCGLPYGDAPAARMSLPSSSPIAATNILCIR